MQEIVYKKFVGCSDCQQQWTPMCYVCKKQGTEYRQEDGKSIKRLSIKKKLVAKENILKTIKTKKEEKSINDSIKYLKRKTKLHEEYKLRRKELSKKYARRIVSLIIKGHKPKCRCCGNPNELTFDHIKPVSKGYPNSLDNGQILCRYCNELKSDRIISIGDLQKEASKYHPYYNPIT